MSASGVPSFGQELPSVRRRRERNPVTWIIVGLVLLVILYSCGRSAYGSYRIANLGTERFHQMLNQGQYEQIYGDTSDDFRKKGTREESLAFLQKVHETLGSQRSSSLKSFNINRVNTGTYLTLVYTSHFDQGDADEQFVWRVQDDDAKLYGYHVNSSQLK
ncbi:MAG TPA: DUF4019 domain-containing protein [Terriglobales bacterium]|nr:DUF4019 domain-containing protein [Terriglobales bacterium]